MDTPDPIRPFRWDLAAPARLGRLLDEVEQPDLWFVDELIRCAARVLALSADGYLYFVGRSMDSMYDLLTGALASTSWAGRLRLLPFSAVWEEGTVSYAEVVQLRVNLAAEGLSPRDLARLRRPVVFVDLVHEGWTYEQLYLQLRRWIADEQAQWDVIRQKLRFIGVTCQKHTSPHTWRWQQDADWPRELPRSAIRNVSMDERTWGYLGGEQPKATLSFRKERWPDEAVIQPGRDEQRLRGLAEAVALVELGRGSDGRAALAANIARQPAFSERWLRALALELRG